MSQTETLSKELIRSYLDMLVKSFKLVPPVPEKALNILFNTKLFGECIKEIKDKMHLSCGLKIYYHNDDNFPEPKTAAYIRLYDPMPLYGSKAFDNLSLELRLKRSLKNSYHSFVYCVAHEMSHVVLYSTRHKLHKSEIATDLFVMVCGFENIMALGRNGYGYLDDKHFIYATRYLQRLRNGKHGPTFLEKVEFFFLKIKKILKPNRKVRLFLLFQTLEDVRNTIIQV